MERSRTVPTHVAAVIDDPCRIDDDDDDEIGILAVMPRI